MWGNGDSFIAFLSTLSLRRATVRPTANTGATKFLSTLSLRRATNRGPYHVERHENFYPRSPCGERPRTPTTVLTLICISIHALLAESDLQSLLLKVGIFYFYPRSPCGERHARRASRQQPAGISIHALLAESDSKSDTATAFPLSFLSTLSLRRATRRKPATSRNNKFLSTLSLRRATPRGGFLLS